MKIGTLSFEIEDKKMILEGIDRVCSIETAIRDNNPDILLAAGYSLQTADDMDKLGERLKKLNWNGLLVAEVMDYQGDPPRLVEIGGTSRCLSKHCAVAWTREEGWRVLGRQFFEVSEQANNERETIVKLFEKALPERQITFRGRQIGVLICGELNSVQRRVHVKALTPEIGVWLDGLDIILNSTHDRMANAGTLKAKREWLSRPLNGRQRIYVSSSNWNTKKPRQNGNGYTTQSPTETLHSIFVDGKNVNQKKVRSGEFEYREGKLDG